jgi:hypothetical protein
MDVVLSDLSFAKGDLYDLDDVALSTYKAILVDCGAYGYTEGLYKSGLLYLEMCSKQAFVVMTDEDCGVHSSGDHLRYGVYKGGLKGKQPTHLAAHQGIACPSPRLRVGVCSRRRLRIRRQCRFSTPVPRQPGIPGGTPALPVGSAVTPRHGHALTSRAAGALPTFCSGLPQPYKHCLFPGQN